jgi:Tfp pilus assembly protein PilF
VTLVDLKPEQQARVENRRLVSPRAQKVLLGFVLSLAVIAVYSPVHWQPFANYDDADYVFDNLHVKSGLHWTTVQWALTTRAAANWHPLTWMSHALDTQIFGLDPAGPHDVNVALHILNALLLFWVLQRATGFVGRSWMVAALFALHPLNVESVAWIAERKNVLSMFFFLLTLGAYRWYAQQPRYSRYLVVAALFALGLMSKPQVITLPFVLLLWDWWPLGRMTLGAEGLALAKRWLERGTQIRVQDGSADIPARSLSALIWEKIPLLGLCAMSAALTLNAQASDGATSYYGHKLRIENAIVSYALYLGKAIWPNRLAVFYPYPLEPYPIREVIAAAALLLAITAAVALAYRRRYLTVGWLWFLGTLVPMIGLVQVGTQAMADRYAYLPFIGLFIMVCWTAADLAQPNEAHEEQQVPRLQFSPTLLRVASVVVLAALALVSHRQVGYWDDHMTLWRHTLEVTNNNWVAENNLGTVLLRAGKPEEAIPHFRKAAALDPTDPNNVLNIGIYEAMHRNFAAAIEDYRHAVAISRNPRTTAKAYNNLGYAYKEQRNLKDARASFQSAVAADPEFVGAWISLGLVEQQAGDLSAAIDSYSRALEMHASDFGYLLLAAALEANGQKLQANEARAKAARLSDDITAAQRHADKLLRE